MAVFIPKRKVVSRVCSMIYIFICMFTCYTLRDESVSHQLLQGSSVGDFSLEGYLKAVKKSNTYDPTNITVKMKPNICSRSTFLQIFIHSAPNHFRNRQVIRRTWASVTSFKKFSINTMFVIGRSGDRLIDLRLGSEARKYSDILWGDFQDTYWNLTLKHLFALKNLGQGCRNVRYVLKSDDDLFVDVFQLINFLTENLRNEMRNFLGCAVALPTEVRRTGKWQVLLQEYPFKFYPRYCAGAAYVASMDVVDALLTAAKSVPKLRIDDVYVTGILRRFVGISPQKMNVYYTENEDKLLQWHSEPSNNYSPWIFGILKSRKFITNLEALWTKTLKAH